MSRNAVGRLCFLMTILCFSQPCRADDPPPPILYTALWRDGTTSKASPLVDWKEPHNQPGTRRRRLENGRTMKLDQAAIDGRRLFDPSNPVRVLKNIDLRPELAGPYVELTNGDILPGKVLSAVKQSPGDKAPRFLVVELTNPMTTWRDDNQVRVRIESVARIMTIGPGSRPFRPGLVVLRDGREVESQKVRWQPGGLLMLLERSVAMARWDELAEIHVPGGNRFTTNANGSSPFDFLGRMTTHNGAVLTYHCDRALATRKRWKCYHLLQPAWADNSILVLTDDIVSVGYRPRSEIPLSLLPAQTLAQRNLTGFTWPWQCNRNVRGKPLSVGGRFADVGIGTHAHSEIAFDLPPGAQGFSCWVGIDDMVGRGGCVRCKVYMDKVDGKPAWASRIMRGGDKPVRIELKDLTRAKRLVLVTEFADNDHPPGADPLDIGDAVSWLSAAVRVDPAHLPATSKDPGDLFPQLRGWSISDAMKKRITSRSQYNRRQGRWLHAMVLDAGKSAREVKPFVVTRTIDVGIGNAWLLASTARGIKQAGFRVTVHANGTKVLGTEGYDSNTNGYGPGEFDPVAYSLGRYLGKKVSLRVTATPSVEDHAEVAGILWGELSLGPLIQGLPKTGQPIKPDVAIETVDSLTIVPKEGAARPWSKQSPPPRLRFCPMAGGLDISPSINEVTCQVDRRWQRFVACIGPAGLSTGHIKSFEIWLDDQLVWQSERFTRLSPPQQIEVPLRPKPTGSRLKLRIVNGSDDHGVWANAGFKLE